jgi:hypothetical protein
VRWFYWANPHLYSSPSLIYISSLKSCPQNPSASPSLVCAGGSNGADGQRWVRASRKGATSRLSWLVQPDGSLLNDRQGQARSTSLLNGWQGQAQSTSLLNGGKGRPRSTPLLNGQQGQAHSIALLWRLDV